MLFIDFLAKTIEKNQISYDYFSKGNKSIKKMMNDKLVKH